MLFKFGNKILKKLRNNFIAKQIRSKFIKEFKIESWNKELFLYHGSLSKTEPQFKDSRFVGLPLHYRTHYREIICDLNKPLPLPDLSADAFQSQDVLEHLEPEKVLDCLNEVYRVLKKGGFFRLSLPDYNSPCLQKRSVYNFKGEILGDLAVGAKIVINDSNSEIYCLNNSRSGNNHLWFPTYEKVNELIMKSKFANALSCNWIHANLDSKNKILNPIPHDKLFFISRCPPNDMRSNGLPVSLIVDLIK